MPKIIPPECEALVRAFSKEKLSSRTIVDKCKSNGFVVSKSTIANILKNKYIFRDCAQTGVKPPPRKSTPTIRASATIKKVADLIKKENPPTQNELAKKFKCSRRSIGRIIHRDLKFVTRKKCKVHGLKPSHVANRKTTARKVYEKYLSGPKSKFMVTIDEAWFYLTNCNGKRKICYRKKGDPVPSNWNVLRQEGFPEKIMVVGGITGKGLLSLHKVPPKVKINSDYYIGKVLKPWLEKEVLDLYGSEASKVVVHHDQASSHTSRKTAAYAADLKSRLGITIMPNSHIPVKSPDLSPMDFFGFGYLKQRLFKRKVTTINGLWKVLNDEWNKIPQIMVSNVIKSWKRRMRLVRQTKGLHIESVSKIHKRKLTN